MPSSSTSADIIGRPAELSARSQVARDVEREDAGGSGRGRADARRADADARIGRHAGKRDRERSQRASGDAHGLDVERHVAGAGDEDRRGRAVGQVDRIARRHGDAAQFAAPLVVDGVEPLIEDLIGHVGVLMC